LCKLNIFIAEGSTFVEPTGAFAIGAFAIGAFAIGAFAIGAFAIGAFAIGAFARILVFSNFYS
jgi:hypothetical protein